MSKNVIFLQDLETGNTDAIIIAKTSTENDVYKAIAQMKEDLDWDWQWEDLVGCLPDDCIIYDRWQAEIAIY